MIGHWQYGSSKWFKGFQPQVKPDYNFVETSDFDLEMATIRRQKYVFESGVPRSAGSISWKIRHFSQFNSSCDDPMISPKFSTDVDETWQLRIHRTYTNLPRLYCQLVPLSLKTFKTHVYAEVSIFIDKLYYLTKRSLHGVVKGSAHGLGSLELGKIRELMKNHYEDAIVLVVKMNVLEEEAKIITKSMLKKDVKRLNNLGDSFKKFLTNSVFADVTIEVKGKIFKSHKIILAANSTVFEAMFQEGTKEHQDNHVVIEDINSDAFEAFLHFLYSGEALHLDEMVSELFVAADKYNVQPLREICIEHMSKNLSVDNAASILALADRHSVDKIKPSVVKFIQKNFMDVVMTGDWASLVNNCPDLVEEVRDAMLNKR